MIVGTFGPIKYRPYQNHHHHHLTTSWGNAKKIYLVIHILSNSRPLPNHDDDDDDDHDDDDHDDDDGQVNNGEQQSIADEIAAVNTSTNFSLFTLLRFG